MRPKPPTSAVVIAILQLVFGVLGLACGICGSAGLASGSGRMMQPPGGKPPADDRTNLVQWSQGRMMYVEQHTPGYKKIETARVMAALIISLIMIVGAVGLLRLQAWGRTLTIIYGFLSIVEKIFDSAFAAATSLPLTREFMQQHPIQGQHAESYTSIMQLLAQAEVVGPLVIMIYPIIILVLVLRPSFAGAFRPAAGASPSPWVNTEEPRQPHDPPEDQPPPM